MNPRDEQHGHAPSLSNPKFNIDQLQCNLASKNTTLRVVIVDSASDLNQPMKDDPSSHRASSPTSSLLYRDDINYR